MNRGAFGLLELLIDRTHALDRLVGLEKRDDESEKHAQGHLLEKDFVASVEQEQRDHHRLKQVHERRTCHVGANPAHGLAKQALRRRTELPNFKLFHAERFDHAVSTDGLLQDLTEFSQARLAVLNGTADAPPQFSDRPDYQR